MDKLSPLRQCERSRHRKSHGGQLGLCWGCQPPICWFVDRCTDNRDSAARDSLAGQTQCGCETTEEKEREGGREREIPFLLALWLSLSGNEYRGLPRLRFSSKGEGEITFLVALVAKTN